MTEREATEAASLADATRVRPNWFDLPPPKSLDRNTFAAALELVDAACPSTADGAATLTAFTAECVARVVPHLPTKPTRWLVCGGGRRNEHLLDQLRVALNRRSAAARGGEDGGGGHSSPRVVVVAVEEGCGGEFIFYSVYYADISCESCSQFDSLPLTSLAAASHEAEEGVMSDAGDGSGAAAAVHFRGDFVEAECFAFLAVRSVLGLPISYPLTTGVAVPMSGGHLTPYKKAAE